MAYDKALTCKKDYREYSPSRLISAARTAMDDIIKLLEISDRVNGCDVVSDSTMVAVSILEKDLPLFESYNDRQTNYVNPDKVTSLRNSIEDSLKLVDDVLCLEEEKRQSYIDEENAARQALAQAQLNPQHDLNELTAAFNDINIFLSQQLQNQDTCQLDISNSIMRNLGSYFHSLHPPVIIPPKPVIDPTSMAIGAISSGTTLLLIYVCLARRNPIIRGCYNLSAKFGFFSRRDKDEANPTEVVRLMSSRRDANITRNTLNP